MEDRTPIYLMSIVGIVALVAVVYMLSGTGSNAARIDTGNAITGNVVDDIESMHYGGLGRFVIAAGLIGVCIFIYRTVD